MASVAGGRVRQFFRNETVKQAVTLLSWMPVGIFFTQNLYSIVTITGPSMQPTFNPNINGGSMLHDLVLIEKWSIKMRQYKRGDVVTLWSPQNPHLLTTKRIIALEGDTVHPLPPSAPNPIRIPEGHCWVEGDSYKQSRDSNAYGPIPLGLINGKVKQILWPSTRYGPVSSTAEKSKGRVVKSSRSMISV